MNPFGVDKSSTCLLSRLASPFGSNPMFDFNFDRIADCTGMDRRSFLRVGGLATLGLSLPAFLRAREAVPVAERKNVNCILMWMQGGPSHIDSFDPKPDAPAEIRGDFGTIPTTLPGIRFADPLPLLAKMTNDFSV